jgi:para-aminobenzoate synthetase component 1
MNDLSPLTGRIIAVHSQPLTWTGTFQDLCRPFARIPGTVILQSGGDHDCARYDLLATLPWLMLTYQGKMNRLTVDGKQHALRGDPFALLQQLIETLRIQTGDMPSPVGAGLFGYLSYDLKDQLERLPRMSVDDLRLPDLLLQAPTFLAIHDRDTGAYRLCIMERILADGTHMTGDPAPFMIHLETLAGPTTVFTGNPVGLKSGFCHDEYLAAVTKIREEIAAGEVYQVNLAQRFTIPFAGDPYQLFCALFARNPAPFFAYIHGGDHIIVSTSPERFIQQTGSRVETRPIKGTRPRGRNKTEGRLLRAELLASPKDDAELSMIVDLLRNDLGKVCKAGTVQVAEHKRLEAYQNVYHLVSRITGELDDDKDSIDLLCATFPGGSITGCPKIRAMEIIDEREPVRRHIYTGAIGYIGFHDTMDLSVAIRTATVTQDCLLFSVGGGIVYDSVPQAEHEETLHKGKTFFEMMADHPQREPELGYLWINGKIVPTDQATVPVIDAFVQYGLGLFETIRVQDGKSLFFADHIGRLNRSWRALFADAPPDLTWEDIITSVLQANRLQEGIATVKIMAGPGEATVPPYRPVLIVQCRPYIHRLAENSAIGLSGLRLVTYPLPRQSSLADHKTLNHLDCILAGRWAKKHGGDEALWLNPDQTVCETHSAGIVVVRGREMLLPQSPYVLPSIMGRRVVAYLKRRGYQLVRKPLTRRSLFSADLVLLTNSLMGAVPAVSLDRKTLDASSRLWIDINDHLFGGSAWRQDLPLA